MTMSVEQFLEQVPKVKRALEEILEPGEVIDTVIKGAHQEYLAATNRRVIVYKKGLMTGATFGSKVASWAYRNITAIDLRSNMSTGVLIVRAAGADDVEASYWASGKKSAAEAPNAISFAKKPDKEVQDLVRRLRQLVADGQQAGAEQSKAPQEGPLEQLKKLGELRAAGVVTAEEFERKKRELLDRI